MISLFKFGTNLPLLFDWGPLAIVAALPSKAQTSINSTRLVSLSILSAVGTGESQNFTLGLVIGLGAIQVPIVMRAAGPSLAAAPFNIGSALKDPFIVLNGSTKSSENDNGGGSDQLKAAMAQVGAFPLSASNSLDSDTFYVC